jgi:Dockerin type I domain
MMLAAGASADTLTATFVAPQGSNAQPGTPLAIEIHGMLSNNDPGNDGLAFISVDLRMTDALGDETIELGTAVLLATPTDGSMDNFAQPLGYDANYGGTPVGNAILQAGGAQNTIGNNPAAAPFLAFPSAELIDLNVGHGGQVLYEGSITFPEGTPAGDYTLSLENVLANVIADNATPGSFAIYPVEAATGVAGAPLVITVEDCAALRIADGLEGVSFGDRAFDGFIDAREGSNDGVNVTGMTEFKVAFTTEAENSDGSALTVASFSVAQTGGPARTIAAVATEDDRTFTVTLDGPIALHEWTTICVDNSVRATCNQAPIAGDGTCIDIGFLPGDVDQNRTVNPIDLFRFRQYVNAVATPEFGVAGDYIDSNRDGIVNPLDLFRFRQGINGVGSSLNAWGGTTLPAQP